MSDIIRPQTRLKPCPYCGADGELISRRDNYYVQCGRCYSRTTGTKSKRLCSDLWNNRVTDPAAIQQMIINRLSEAYHDEVIAKRGTRKSDGIYLAIELVAGMVIHDNGTANDIREADHE